MSKNSLSMISLPDLSLPEINTISLPCWQDSICLSEIWIPSRLLGNRQKSSNIWATQGLYHTLEKRGQARQVESFSIYSDSEDSEDDLFQSDSDEAFDLDSISSDKVEIKEDSQKSAEKFLKFNSLKEATNISLNEILNSTDDVDITNFKFEKPHKKNKNAKKKNKVVKSVTLDKFLEDYTEENRQEDYANDYLSKLIRSQTTNFSEDSKVQLKNRYEFPELTSNEIKFMHSEKIAAECPEISFKNIAEVVSQSDKNASTSHADILVPVPTHALGKFVVENIPREICREDIYSVLCGYGDQVKDFYLEPDGNFWKAFIEIDINEDIDWIIECLNGTEPFGASSRLLKCYKL